MFEISTRHTFYMIFNDKSRIIYKNYNTEQFILNVYYILANFVFRDVLRVCFWTGRFAIVPLTLTQIS